MSRGRILIVDDEPVVRNSLSEWFAGEGYDTRALASGKLALTPSAKVGPSARLPS